MHKMLIYICLFISFSLSLNQSQTIEGYVYDVSQDPIYNVQIYIEELSIGTTTDSSGYFNIEIPSMNGFSLLVSHVAYKTKNIYIDSSSDEIRINLASRVIDAKDVVVTALGYNSYIKDTPVITQVISSRDIAQSSYTSLEDIIKFAIPNVQKVHDPHGNDRIKIQGLDNKFTVFLVDGKRISGEFAGNIDFSLVNLSDIEKIEFVKSGMSTVYGSDAMGGVINIITKQYSDSFYLSISHIYNLPNIQSTSLDIGGNYKTLNYKLHLDYNDTPGYDLTDYSPLSKTVEEQVYGKITNSIKYNNGSVVIDYINRYYVKKVNRYNSIFNTTTLQYDTTLHQQNPRYFDYFNSLSIGYQINQNARLEINATNELYDKSFYFPYYYGGYPNPRGEIKTSSLPNRFDFLTTLQYSFHNHMLYFGIEYAKETYKSFNIIGLDGVSIEDESIFSDENQKEVAESSIFISDSFSFLSLEFVLGNRITRYSLYDWYMVPNTSIRKEFSNYNLRFNYSKGYRVPALKELYYDFQSHDPAIYGNSNLKPSLSDYISLSFESRELTNTYLEVYANKIQDMISFINKDDGIYYTNGDEITLYGANLSIRKDIFKDVTFESIYSYTDGISDSDALLEGISTHSVNMKLNYKLLNNVNVIYSVRYTDSKNIILFESGLKKSLEAHSISDILLSLKYRDVNMKFGVKNIFNYFDPSRNDSSSNEYLTSVDPGRRIYFNIGLNF